MKIVKINSIKNISAHDPTKDVSKKFIGVKININLSKTKVLTNKKNKKTMSKKADL